MSQNQEKGLQCPKCSWQCPEEEAKVFGLLCPQCNGALREEKMKKFEITPAGEMFKVSVREEEQKSQLFFHLTRKEMETLSFYLEVELSEEEEPPEEGGREVTCPRCGITSWEGTCPSCFYDLGGNQW